MGKPTSDGYWWHNNGVWYEPVEVNIEDGVFYMIGHEQSYSIDEDSSDDDWGYEISTPWFGKLISNSLNSVSHFPDLPIPGSLYPNTIINKLFNVQSMEIPDLLFYTKKEGKQNENKKGNRNSRVYMQVS